jgi:hypothetical protein
MRYPGAYYLLLLYATLVLQPLLVVTQDFLSHTFEDAIHIATVHAKYGNNHVEIELAQTNSDDNGKNHDSPKSEEQIPAHVFPNPFDHCFNSNLVIDQFVPLKPNKLPSVFISKQIPPPKPFAWF